MCEKHGSLGDAYHCDTSICMHEQQLSIELFTARAIRLRQCASACYSYICYTIISGIIAMGYSYVTRAGHDMTNQELFVYSP